MSYILGNVLEVKISIISKYEAGKGYKKFCERRVNINKVLGLDIS